MKNWIAMALVAAATLSSAVLASAPPQTAFPHSEHAGLFPVCTGCHTGILSGDDQDAFPEPEDCRSCHSGDLQPEVDWQGRTPRPSNLAFSHVEHDRESAREGQPAECATCHQVPGATSRMNVRPASAETCLSCHAHEAPEHLSEGRECLSCHVPLTDARDLSTAWVAGLPKPATHETPDFVLTHGAGTPSGGQACATCHARESCTRCHFNESAVAPITALRPDARVATLTAERTPEYPVPASHLEGRWTWTHGGEARDGGESCANCHARSGCVACHQGRAPAAVNGLPSLAADDGRGVTLAAEDLRVHGTGFSLSHGASAASMEDSCAGCHAESFCESCHEASGKPTFHIGDFVQSHGPQAYGNEAECVSCHNTQVFCRACHTGVGISSAGRVQVAFHNANPLWLFGHGQAARQGLESCASCHSQSDCTQCHAAVGGWGINPHGPDFEASRLDEANFFTCTFCHIGGIPR